MSSTMALKLDMMNIEAPCRSAAGHRAAMMIAREHLLADPGRDGGGRSFRGGRIERTKVLCIA
jgi:hypothetical protein